MGLLSDEDILRLLNHEIVITPFSQECLTPVGYDFSVGNFVYSLEYGLIRPENGVYELPGKSTIQILTKEALWVSKRIAGTFHSKVSLVSRGLSNISTTLDPEWNGPLLITLRNNMDDPFMLKTTDSFVTLMLYELTTPTETFHWRNFHDTLAENRAALEERLRAKTESYIMAITRALEDVEAGTEFRRLVQEAHHTLEEELTRTWQQSSDLTHTLIDRQKFARSVKVKKVHEDAVLPIYEHVDDSGADVISIEDCILQPMERRAIGTGLTVEIPFGFELHVRPRSGLSLKNGITVLNTPGTIDAGYRGEIKVILANISSEPFSVKKGQKIAQLVLTPIYRALFEEASELSPTVRDTKGFGSTGTMK